DVAPAHLDEYVALAAAARDPWFAALAADHRAQAALAHGDRAAAAAILTAAIREAVAARVDYRAELLELALANVYLDVDRWPEAYALARSAFVRARAGGAAGHVRPALPVLGNIALRRFHLALAVAYFEEEDVAADPSDCATLQHARYMRAQAE